MFFSSQVGYLLTAAAGKSIFTIYVSLNYWCSICALPDKEGFLKTKCTNGSRKDLTQEIAVK